MPSASAAPICACTAWKVPAVTSSSAARADVESLSRRPRTSRRQTVAAAVLRPDPLLPGQRRGTAALRAGFPYGRYPLRIEQTTLRLARVPSRSSRANAGDHRRVPRTPARRLRCGARALARRRHRPKRRSSRPRRRARRRRCRRAASPITSPVSGSVWQIKVRRPAGVGWRGTAGDHGSHEDGDQRQRRERRHRDRRSTATRADRRSAGDLLIALLPGAERRIMIAGIDRCSRAYRSGALTPARRRGGHHRRLRRTAQAHERLDLASSRTRCCDRAPPSSMARDLASTAAVRRAVRHQGQHRSRWDLPTTAACPAFTHMPASLGACGAEAARCRRHRDRQDQSRPVRHGSRRHALALRRAAATASIRSTSAAAPRAARPWRWRWASRAFSLGTDTAGSGRVPAAFNNLVGYKPTLGLLEHRAAWCPPAARSMRCRSSR